jgi:hypothetical protein
MAEILYTMSDFASMSLCYLLLLVYDFCMSEVSTNLFCGWLSSPASSLDRCSSPLEFQKVFENRAI